MTETFGVALFASTRIAMRAEDTGKAAGLHVRIIPTPGRIVSTCGFSLRYDLDEEGPLQACLADAGVAVDAWYHAERHGLIATYTKQ